MLDPSLNQIESNYDFRTKHIPFDGSTYKDTVSRDVEILIELANNISSSHALLDVGCGLGWHLEALAQAGFMNLWGLDISSSALKEFASRCDAVDGRTIKLICGQIETFKPAKFFDIVTSFLSCIGQYGSRQFDVNHLVAMNQKLRPNGLLILSAFSKCRIAEVTGSFSRTYSKLNGTNIETIVSFDQGTSILKIEQTFEGCGEKLIENIFIYPADDIAALAHEAGFRDIQIWQPKHSIGQSMLTARTSHFW